jgi:hypothetical protein
MREAWFSERREVRVGTEYQVMVPLVVSHNGEAENRAFVYDREDLEQQARAIWLDATDANAWKPGEGMAWKAWLERLRGKEDADCAICATR